jgi:DNA-binding response OmpR family regulator
MAKDNKSSKFSDRLADLRHDLRTPAGHIMGYAEMLAEEFEDAGRTDSQAMTSAIRATGETVIELIDKYLGPSHKDPAQVDFGTIGEKILEQSIIAKDKCKSLRQAILAMGLDGLMADLDKIEKASQALHDMVEGMEAFVQSPGEEIRDDDRETEKSASLGTGSENPLGEGGVILVVDDDQGNRDLLQRRLESQGYDPVSVENGEQALQFVRENPVDMILLDMVMPGLDGFGVLEWLKRDPVLQNIPVVMLSALDDMDRIVRCITMGAEDYLFKPFNPILLKARISATLEKSRLRRQRAPRLKVFISSPGDVEPERRTAKRVINRLNEELAGKVFMIPILWEDEPLLASETAQTQIELPRETDIFIGIFWSRMGTMLPDNIKRTDGSRYGSGTEFEFEDAVAGHDATGSPEILAYRKTSEPTVGLSNKDLVLDRLDQNERLDAFMRQWFATEDGLSIARVYHAFETEEQFEELLEQHLRKLALKLAPS